MNKDDLIHKRKPVENGRGPRSWCGQRGYTTHLWRNVNCAYCLKKRK